MIFSESLHKFGLYLKEEDYAPSTIEIYKYYLNKYIEEKMNLERYSIVEHIKSKSNGPKILQAIKKYAYFLYDKKELSDQEYYQIKNIKIKYYPVKPTTRPKIFLKKDRWHELYELTKQHGCCQFALWLGLNFSLRIGEIINITIHDINLNRKLLAIMPETRGKTINARRELPITEKQIRTINNYFEFRNQFRLEHDKIIFSLRDYQPVGPDAVRNWFKKYLPFYFRPHDARRSHATHIDNSTENIKALSYIMGHGDPKTTRMYLGKDREEKLDLMREAQEKAGL